MLRPNDFIKLKESLVKGYSEYYNKFLDDRTKEHLKKVEKKLRKETLLSTRNSSEDEEKGSIRQKIFKEVLLLLEEGSRRDTTIPRFKYDIIINKINYLETLRVQHGIDKKHPGILAARAKALMKKEIRQNNYENYVEAINIFKEAIEINNGLPKLKRKSDNIYYLVPLRKHQLPPS